MTYSFVYILFFLLIVFFHCTKIDMRIVLTVEGNRTLNGLHVKPVYMVFLFIGGVFIGLRGYLEADWLIYYPYFHSLPTLWDGIGAVAKCTYGNFFEPGYVLLNILVKSVWSNYLFFQFVCTVIDLLVLNMFFKEYTEDYYFLAWIFFFAFYGYVIEIITLRSAKAVMCFLISLKYIDEKKATKYFLWNLLGISMHLGAVIYPPLYFFIKKRHSKVLYMIGFVVGNLFFLLRFSVVKEIIGLLSRIFSGRLLYVYETRILGEDHPLGFSIGYFERIVTFLLMLYFTERMIKKDKRMVIFWNLMYVYICVNLYCFDIYAFYERIPLMLACSYWVLYPKVYGELSSKNRIIFIAIIVLYGILKTNLLMGNKMASYENVLFGISDTVTRKLNFTY